MSLPIKILKDLDLKDVLTRLENLKALEVSYVPRGANRIPFLITKEDEVKLKGLEKLLKTQLKNPDKIAKILEDGSLEDPEREAIMAALQVLAGLEEAGQVSSETVAELMALTEVVPAADGSEGGDGGSEGGSEGGDEGDSEEVAALKAQIAKMEEELAAVEKQDGDEQNGEDQEGVEKGMGIMKSDGTLNLDAVPENLRASISALWSNNQKTAGALEKVTKALDEEREIRITKAYEEKAAQYGNLNIEGLAVVLKDIGLKAPDSFEKVAAILKVANDAAGKTPAAFGEIGVSKGHADNGDDPDAIYSQIQSRAVEVYKDAKGVRPAEAVTRFVTETPEGRALMAKYEERRRA